MLEKASNDAGHANPVADSRNSRTQRADASHEKIDRHAILRRAVERSDHLGIHQRVHFRDDASLAAGSGVRGLPLHELETALAQTPWRHEKLPVQPLPREAGEKVEEVADVRT